MEHDFFKSSLIDGWQILFGVWWCYYNLYTALCIIHSSNCFNYYLNEKRLIMLSFCTFKFQLCIAKSL